MPSYQWNEYENLLRNLSLSDAAVAANIGCTSGAVAYQRKQRGIESAIRAKSESGRKRQYWLPDTLIQKIADVDRNRVSKGFASNQSEVVRRALEIGLPLV